MEYFKLSNGFLVPKVGMGTNTFGKKDNDFHGEITGDTKELLSSYQNGYRLIDTAIMYRNEAVIGKSIKESKIGRESIIVTSKISARSPFIDSEETIRNYLDQSIEHIGEYVDIYLIHHPSADMETNLNLWRVLESYYDKGLFKVIGVSNFDEEQLKYLMDHARIKPMMNQIESNPNRFNHELIKYSLMHHCLPVAWGPLDPVPNKDVLTNIGSKYHKTWAQVLLRYQIQRGVAVIPKSHNAIRQKENIDIFDFNLTDEDIRKIEG